jgi:starvation-inducible outer membrane lipoprotein
MKRKTKRILLIVGIVATLAFALTACTTPAARQQQQQENVLQQSITLRVIELIASDQL